MSFFLLWVWRCNTSCYVKSGHIPQKGRLLGLQMDRRTHRITNKLSRWRVARFKSKIAKDSYHAYITKNTWFPRKLANELLKFSLRRDLIRARMSTGCPRSTSKSRASSLFVGSRDEHQHGSWKRLGQKRESFFIIISCVFCTSSISHDPSNI